MNRSIAKLILSIAVAFTFAACGEKPATEAPHDHPMACAKCDCKAMAADPADKTKCKSCSHLATEHTRHDH